MPKIFISYRRLDSQDFTDRLFDYMVRHFGTENVFQDVGDSTKIPPGVDFVEYLAEQVRRCDVVLVVIGEQWTGIMQERAKRDDDFVRIEVESALKQGKIVIPVLKSNTYMPASGDLPESIRQLTRRNASRVRPNPDFVRDCDTLANGIRTVFGMNNTAAEAPAPTRPTSLTLLPALFAWIEIPGGRGTMKTDESGVLLTIPTEKYWISKYPITNAQFAKFIEADGYNQQKWWTEAGWEAKAKGWEPFQDTDKTWKLRVTNQPWIQPRYWTDNTWNRAEQPVVGVSWYEAVAFCLWLSETTGEKIMLPTEDQWQYAAQGDDGRAYPWGNDWDASRCNNNVGSKGIGKTTPVREYEGKGDSPFAVVDMAGNVWEWCLTDYYNKTSDINSDATLRVLRGGSWSNINTDNFRCDYRNGYDPCFRDLGFGFRISRS